MDEGEAMENEPEELMGNPRATSGRVQQLFLLLIIRQRGSDSCLYTTCPLSQDSGGRVGYHRMPLAPGGLVLGGGWLKVVAFEVVVLVQRLACSWKRRNSGSGSDW